LKRQHSHGRANESHYVNHGWNKGETRQSNEDHDESHGGCKESYGRCQEDVVLVWNSCSGRQTTISTVRLLFAITIMDVVEIVGAEGEKKPSKDGLRRN
jgi:hypothetical protein